MASKRSRQSRSKDSVNPDAKRKSAKNSTIGCLHGVKKAVSGVLNKLCADGIDNKYRPQEAYRTTSAEPQHVESQAQPIATKPVNTHSRVVPYDPTKPFQVVQTTGNFKHVINIVQESKDRSEIATNATRKKKSKKNSGTDYSSNYNSDAMSTSTRSNASILTTESSKQKGPRRPLSPSVYANAPERGFYQNQVYDSHAARNERSARRRQMGDNVSNTGSFSSNYAESTCSDATIKSSSTIRAKPYSPPRQTPAANTFSSQHVVGSGSAKVDSTKHNRPAPKQPSPPEGFLSNNHAGSTYSGSVKSGSSKHRASNSPPKQLSPGKNNVFQPIKLSSQNEYTGSAIQTPKARYASPPSTQKNRDSSSDQGNIFYCVHEEPCVDIYRVEPDDDLHLKTRKIEENTEIKILDKQGKLWLKSTRLSIHHEIELKKQIIDISEQYICWKNYKLCFSSVNAAQRFYQKLVELGKPVNPYEAFGSRDAYAKLCFVYTYNDKQQRWENNGGDNIGRALIVLKGDIADNCLLITTCNYDHVRENIPLLTLDNIQQLDAAGSILLQFDGRLLRLELLEFEGNQLHRHLIAQRDQTNRGSSSASGQMSKSQSRDTYYTAETHFNKSSVASLQLNDLFKTPSASTRGSSNHSDKTSDSNKSGSSSPYDLDTLYPSLSKSMKSAASNKSAGSSSYDLDTLYPSPNRSIKSGASNKSSGSSRYGLDTLYPSPSESIKSGESSRSGGSSKSKRSIDNSVTKQALDRLILEQAAVQPPSQMASRYPVDSNYNANNSESRTARGSPTGSSKANSNYSLSNQRVPHTNTMSSIISSASDIPCIPRPDASFSTQNVTKICRLNKNDKGEIVFEVIERDACVMVKRVNDVSFLQSKSNKMLSEVDVDTDIIYLKNKFITWRAYRIYFKNASFAEEFYNSIYRVFDRPSPIIRNMDEYRAWTCYKICETTGDVCNIEVYVKVSIVISDNGHVRLVVEKRHNRMFIDVGINDVDIRDVDGLGGVTICVWLTNGKNRFDMKFTPEDAIDFENKIANKSKLLELYRAEEGAL